ncbi:MAG: hypothetical protein K6L73_04020 [Cellvibrionaceae bacterium]
MNLQNLLAFLILIYSSHSFTHTGDDYQKPIALPSNIKNLPELFEKASKQSNWEFEISNEKYIAIIKYKNHHTHAELATTQQQVIIKNLDSKQNSCEKNCKKASPKTKDLLLKLRRSIAIQITKILRTQAREARFNHSTK